jgi:hypothetical protein
VYGVDAFQEHLRHVGQINRFDRCLCTSTQFHAEFILVVLKHHVQAVQEGSNRNEHASLVFYLDPDPFRDLGIRGGV